MHEEMRGKLVKPLGLPTLHRPNTAPPIVRDVLQSPGQPLDAATRAAMEPRFAHDFSGVRVHTDGRAAESARAVNALAYTVGQNVVFGPGQYAPGTAQGQGLLGHELAHVVQQVGATPAAALNIAPSGGALEAEAHRAASTGHVRERAPGSLLQRFDSPEHVQLGEAAGGGTGGLIVLDCHDRDFPERGDPARWPPAWRTLLASATAEQRRAVTQGLTYGEIVALSGDFYETFDDLSRASLREIFQLIPLVRGHATTSQLQQATGGRYLALAERNVSHFSNVPAGSGNVATWRRMHTDAIQLARQARTNAALANRAWALNAAADHYLTDAFSSGHMRTPRAQLLQQGSLGNVESKILHDLDNEHGVEVTNRRGDRWTAYGDEQLSQRHSADNRRIAVEAVERSRRDIADAIAQGSAYPAPTPSTVFAAEELLPTVVDMARDRWTGRAPTYVPAPGGQMVRAADDYTMTRDRIVRREAPGIVSGFFSDDDEIVEWVNSNDLPAIGGQPVAQKIRMIETILGGTLRYITDGDVAAIERICQSVPTANEMAVLRAHFYNQLSSRMTSIGQRTRVRIALQRL